MGEAPARFEMPDDEEQAMFRDLVKEVVKRVRPGWAPPEETGIPEVGRNDPCPCGSGKKYKRCHGAEGV